MPLIVLLLAVVGGFPLCVCISTHAFSCTVLSCSLPPVQQESSSDQADRTDPYEDFTFETDTTGEEDEAEGSGGRSESDQAPDSKGESPKSDKGAVESTTAQPAQSTSGDLSEAAVSDGANKIGLFNVAEVKSFVGHLAPPEMVKETFVPAYVSYVSSPTDFWVRM